MNGDAPFAYSGLERIFHERGRLAVGDVADLVVLASDVASDARPFRDPLAVVKDGTLAFERR